MILIIAFLSAFACAQDLDSLLAILENRQDDDQWLDLLSGKANMHMLYFQLAYESDSYFAGRDVGLEQPNLTAQALYSYKQITLSAAAIAYPVLYPPIQAVALSGNYRLPLQFPVNIDVGYGRYFFNSDNDTLSSYPNAFTLGLSYNAKYWGVSSEFSLLAGTDGIAPQIDAGGYGQFDLFTWKKTNSISVRPQIGFYFGSEVTARSQVPPGLAKNNGQGQGNGQGNGPGQNDDEVIYDTSFGLLNTSMSVQLSATFGDLDIGLTILNNRPRSVTQEIAYIPTTMIGVNAGYAFSFIGK